MLIRERKSNRLKNFDYSSVGYYFITIYTRNREEWFGQIIDHKMILNKYGRIVKKIWLDIPNHYKDILLDENIIMSNHLHGIIVIENTVHMKRCVGTIHELSLREKITIRRNMTIPKIIGRFKMTTAKLIHQLRLNSFQWQRSFYDHIIRNEYQLIRIRQYIKNNPKNWKKDRNNPENLNMET